MQHVYWVITIDENCAASRRREAAIKFRLKCNLTRASDLFDFKRELKIITTRSVSCFPRLFLSFFFFLNNKISTPTPDNPLVNNEPLNPSGGVVMTIIGDFRRQEWFVRGSIVYRTRLRGGGS